MIIELTGQEVLLGYLGLGLFLMVGVYLYRWYNNGKKIQSLETLGRTSLSTRTKYPEKNILHHRPRTFGLGLACSMLFAIFAMSWTVYQKDLPILDDFTVDTDQIEVTPRTVQKPIPPPPPPVEKEILVDDEILEEDDLPDTSTEVDDIVEFFDPEPPVDVPAPPPPPLPEPEDEPSDIPFKVVEKYPYFDGCTDKACSEKAFLNYIYKDISYPSIATENGIEGRVTAQFVIERDGKISDIQILRGIGAGCDEEVYRVLDELKNGGPLWTPGEQRGKPVRVLFTLPVTFALNK